MTDTTERRLAGILAQMNEMLESRLPEHLPAQRPDWQIWTFIAGVLFYTGISFAMIQQNRDTIEKILVTHKADMNVSNHERDSIENELITHINEENIHNLQRSEQARKRLEDQLRGK